MLNFLENFTIVDGINLLGTTAAIEGDVISLKYAQKCWIVMAFHPAAVGVTITVQRVLTVDGVPAVLAAGTVFPVWYNVNTAASDAFVRGADDDHYDFVASAFNQLAVIEVDPSLLGAAYDCMSVVTTGYAVTDTLAVLYLVQNRYPQAIPPSMIVD
jgi:hypothetical protein